MLYYAIKAKAGSSAHLLLILGIQAQNAAHQRFRSAPALPRRGLLASDRVPGEDAEHLLQHSHLCAETIHMI